MNEINEQDTVLHARNVQKAYGSRGSTQHVLKGINLRVLRKEFVGIMGPSGSGKTTLLNVLATIDRTTDGTILIDNEDISAMTNAALSAFRRNKLGFIFQDYNLLDTLTVKENILLPVSLSKLSKKQAEREFAAIADVLGIRELSEKYPFEISGGQKQRTAAGRALIHQPSISLLEQFDSGLKTLLRSSVLYINKTLHGFNFLLLCKSVTALMRKKPEIIVLGNSTVSSCLMVRVLTLSLIGLTV
ncbi:MAG: ABC transporter ATP-binding protein [Paenibacillus sp.]|nr:ABC transporter ATP-binding protein [Paenibacillus sp.]